MAAPAALSPRHSRPDLPPRVNQNSIGELPGLGWESTRRLRSSLSLLNVSNYSIFFLCSEFGGFFWVLGTSVIYCYNSLNVELDQLDFLFFMILHVFLISNFY